MYTPRPTKKTRGAKTQKKTRRIKADRDPPPPPPPPPLIRLTPDNPRFSAIPAKQTLNQATKRIIEEESEQTIRFILGII